MTYMPQEVRVRVPEPQVRVDPNEINARVEEAIQRALSQTGNINRGELRNQLESEIRAAIDEARSEGQSITIQPPFDPQNMIPPQAVDISIAFFGAMAFIIVGLPLVRAFARRMDRRGESASASEIMPRLDRIEQAVEAIAIEVERVSEGQRFTTKAIAGLSGANAAGEWASGRDGQPRVGQIREPERVPASERRP
jgi:hypothetical protein